MLGESVEAVVDDATNLARGRDFAEVAAIAGGAWVNEIRMASRQ